MKQTEADDRQQRGRKAIDKIMAEKGTVYTVGLLMGILCRMCRTDFQLVQDLEQRARNCTED